jgi:hypothetical protein
MPMVDIRSMKSIIEWKAQPSCNAQFSFDENSIYAVDDNGDVRFLLHFHHILINLIVIPMVHS